MNDNTIVSVSSSLGKMEDKLRSLSYLLRKGDQRRVEEARKVLEIEAKRILSEVA